MLAACTTLVKHQYCFDTKIIHGQKKPKRKIKWKMVKNMWHKPA